MSDKYMTKEEFAQAAGEMMARIEAMLAPAAEQASVEVAPAKAKVTRTRKAAATKAPAKTAPVESVPALELSVVAPAWLKAMLPGAKVENVPAAEFTNVAKALAGHGGGFSSTWNEAEKVMVYVGRSEKQAGKEIHVSKKGRWVSRVS